MTVLWGSHFCILSLQVIDSLRKDIALITLDEFFEMSGPRYYTEGITASHLPECSSQPLKGLACSFPVGLCSNVSSLRVLILTTFPKTDLSVCLLIARYLPHKHLLFNLIFLNTVYFLASLWECKLQEGRDFICLDHWKYSQYLEPLLSHSEH